MPLLPCAHDSPMGLVNELIPSPGFWLQHTAADFALGQCYACTHLNSFISGCEILQRNRAAFCLCWAWIVNMHAVGSAGSESTPGGWCVCSAHAAGGGYVVRSPYSVYANLECSVCAVCMHLEAVRSAFV